MTINYLLKVRFAGKANVSQLSTHTVQE